MVGRWMALIVFLGAGVAAPAQGLAATAAVAADTVISGDFRLSRPPDAAPRGPWPSASVRVREGRLERLRLECPPAPFASRLNPLEATGDFRLEIVWTGWQAPGKANNADNACAFTAADFRCVDAHVRQVEDGQELVLELRGPEDLLVELIHVLPPEGCWLRRQLRVRDPRGRGHFLHAIYPLDSVVSQPARVLKPGGFGQPVALLHDSGEWGAFLGLEWPAADNRAEVVADGVRVRCGQEIGEVITPEGVASEPVVMAVTPDGRVKHWFMAYLDDVRVAPPRPYTLYNSWYDLRSAEYPKVTPDRVMNEANVLRIARLLRENMIERHGITLDAFVLDDGWDVYESDWVLRPEQFPRGLQPIATALAPTGTRLGIWYGPTGGYSFRRKRVNWMREHGYETVGDQLWVGGPRYSALLQRRTTDMARAGVRYFKWDGFQFLGTGPDLGTPPGIYARRAVLERVRAMADSVRAVDPDMFLNITSGTWLSPWWLRLADQIWMGGEDYGAADVPSPTTRDASITYRDLVLHEDFRQHGFWFPLANLMTHGVLKGTIDVQDIGRGEPLAKFADEVVFYLARGVTMHELYISPDILSEGEWRVLADALRWARDRFPVLRRTEMIGGDPNRLEPYGYAHWDGVRGILAVRNPDAAPRAMTVVLDPADGLDPDASDLVLERIYPTRWVAPALFRAGESVELTPLLGYEAAVYEVRPWRDEPGPLLADVVFEELARDGATRTLAVLAAGPQARVLGAPGAATLARDGVPLDPAQLSALRRGCDGCFADGQVAAARDGRSFTARLKLEPSARLITAGVLLLPREAGGAMPEPVVTMTLDGVAAVPERQAVAGKWVWLTIPLPAGEHRLRVAFAPAADGAPWTGSASVWLTGAEAVEPVAVTLTGPDPLPPARSLPATGRAPGELPRSVRVGEVRLGPGEER